MSHGVWLYYRFPLSYRDVQELLFERGIDVTHEVIRQWCLKFGQDYANQLKRRRAQPGDKWYLDEVFLTINGKRHYLWRAVDQGDNVLDLGPNIAKLSFGATAAVPHNVEPPSIVPEVLKPLWRKFRIPDRRLNVAMPQIMLDSTRIQVSVGEVKAAGVPQHVRMDRKGQGSGFTRPADNVVNRASCQWRDALREEDIRHTGMQGFQPP